MRLGRSREKGPQTDLSRLLAEDESDPDAEVDVGRLVRALARSVVHTPVPGAPKEPRPRLVKDEDPPLLVIDDDAGRHALIYTSPRALVQAWGDGVTAASVSMARLLVGWPRDVDLYINHGLPRHLVVPTEVLRLALHDVGGLPTAAAVTPSPGGYDLAIPDPEFSQLIGAARGVADASSDVLALWRAELLNRESSPRPLLVLLVELTPAGTTEFSEVADRFGRAVSEIEPRPLMVVLSREGHTPSDPELADRVRALDDPFWSRTES